MKTLHNILNEQQHELLLEVAILQDVGKEFVQLTYFIESDEIKVHLIFDMLQKLMDKVKGGAEAFPKTTAFLSNFRLGGDWREAKSKVGPGLKYFHERMAKMNGTMRILQACRRFDPNVLATEVISEEKVRSEFTNIPCLQQNLDKLIADFAAVKLAATHAKSISWWAECPVKSWQEAASKILAVSPTSASIERFSFCFYSLTEQCVLCAEWNF